MKGVNKTAFVFFKALFCSISFSICLGLRSIQIKCQEKVDYSGSAVEKLKQGFQTFGKDIIFNFRTSIKCINFGRNNLLFASINLNFRNQCLNF